MTLPREVPGWYGKLPSLGDFAMRRLPAALVERWDEWLSSELHAARTDAGDAWGALWDAAPTACFVHAAGTLDELAWHGIVMPSCDRIGRRFPLTVAQRGAVPFDGDDVRPHWRQLVEAARTTRDAHGGVTQFEALLAAIVPWQDPALPDTDSCGWGLWCDATSSVQRLAVAAALPRGAEFRRLIVAAR